MQCIVCGTCLERNDRFSLPNASRCTLIMHANKCQVYRYYWSSFTGALQLVNFPYPDTVVQLQGILCIVKPCNAKASAFTCQQTSAGYSITPQNSVEVLYMSESFIADILMQANLCSTNQTCGTLNLSTATHQQFLPKSLDYTIGLCTNFNAPRRGDVTDLAYSMCTNSAGTYQNCILQSLSNRLYCICRY